MLNFFTLSVDEILGSERFAPAVARFLLCLVLRRVIHNVRLRRSSRLTTVFVPMHARQRYKHSGQTQPKSMPSD